MICSAKGCDRPVRIRKHGLCERHYRSKLRYGDPYAARENQTYGQARTVRADGYIYITVGGKQVMEHRHIMACALGRPLTAEEVVHHRDGDRQNNDLSNLELLPSQSAHSKLHYPKIALRNNPHFADNERLKRGDEE
jgi:hypothetical protein